MILWISTPLATVYGNKESFQVIDALEQVYLALQYEQCFNSLLRYKLVETTYKFYYYTGGKA